MESIIKSTFADFLKENTGATVLISYTFGDGTIPVSEIEAVSCEDFNPLKFGSHVTTEGSGQGPVVYIDTNLAENDEIYFEASTPAFMNRQEDFNRFLILLRNQP